MAGRVQTCKDTCRNIADRVRDLERLVHSLRQSQTSGNVNRALTELSNTLSTAQELVRKCTKSKIKNLMTYSKLKSVDNRLTNKMQVLSTYLQADQLALAYPSAVASRPQTPTVVHAAMLEMEDDTMTFTEIVVVAQ